MTRLLKTRSRVITLSRASFLFTLIRRPIRLLPPLEREFLKLVLSQSGQNVVLKDGYIPLPRVVEGTLAESGYLIPKTG